MSARAVSAAARAVSRASSSSSSSSKSSASATTGRGSLPAQQLLHGGHIPGARRLQQFLLLPHLSRAETHQTGQREEDPTRATTTASAAAPKRAFTRSRHCAQKTGSTSSGNSPRIPNPVLSDPGEKTFLRPSTTLTLTHIHPNIHTHTHFLCPALTRHFLESGPILSPK